MLVLVYRPGMAMNCQEREIQWERESVHNLCPLRMNMWAAAGEPVLVSVLWNACGHFVPAYPTRPAFITETCARPQLLRWFYDHDYHRDVARKGLYTRHGSFVRVCVLHLCVCVKCGTSHTGVASQDISARAHTLSMDHGRLGAPWRRFWRLRRSRGRQALLGKVRARQPSSESLCIYKTLPVIIKRFVMCMLLPCVTRRKNNKQHIRK